MRPDREIMITPDRSSGSVGGAGSTFVLLVLAAVVVGVLPASVAPGVRRRAGGAAVTAAAVADDGSARIMEVIDWDFGANHRHGIFRDLPGLRTSAPIEVSSPDAPPTPSPSARPARRGSASATRTVRSVACTAVLTYTVDGVVRGGRLA